jgi:hypothetical protein
VDFILAYDFATVFRDTKKLKPNGVVAMIGVMSNFVFGVDITDTDAAAMPDNPLTDFNNDAWADWGMW